MINFLSHLQINLIINLFFLFAQEYLFCLRYPGSRCINSTSQTKGNSNCSNLLWHLKDLEYPGWDWIISANDLSSKEKHRPEASAVDWHSFHLSGEKHIRGRRKIKGDKEDDSWGWGNNYLLLLVIIFHLQCSAHEFLLLSIFIVVSWNTYYL